jgi:signal transduction histidine kinase
MAASPASEKGRRKPASYQGNRRALIEAELVESVAWLIRLRWIAGIGVILATWSVGAVFSLQARVVPLYLIGAAILLYNLGFYLLERRYKRLSASAPAFSRLAVWQAVADWLGMILLIHFSGGIESPAILFLFFHIIIAFIFFTPRTAYLFALLAIGLLSTIAILEYFAILPHQPIVGFLDAPLYQNGLFVTAYLFFFTSTCLFTAYLGSSIQERMRQREEEIVLLTASLQKVTDRLQALNDGARAVGSTLELTQVLNRLVESTAKAMGVKACSIRLLDESGHRLEPVAVYGLSKQYLEKGPVDPDSNPLAREVLGGRIINIADVHASQVIQYPEEARREGIRSMLSAPLIGKERPMGILRAYDLKPGRFSTNDEAFLSAIAAQGSIAIENALAYQAVDRLDKAKGQFIRIVSHELRSPVSVTRSLLRTLIKGYAGELTDQQVDMLERASRRLDFLQRLVDDLLDLAAGRTDIREKEIIEPLDLAVEVQRVVKRFEIAAREKKVDLVWQNKSGDQKVFVLASVDSMDRVMNNLVSNAVKYTLQNGRISVTLTKSDGEAQLSIEDTGIGIPAESMSHLFDEFYRAPNARALEKEGTGLGLPITKDILTRLGGRLQIRSKENVGTCITVTLPAIEPEAQDFADEDLSLEKG